MITNITLHPNQQAQLKATDLHQIRSLATAQFPYPLAVSFQNYLNAAKKDDKTLALVIFANDVTTTVFQFLSLILASEYIESSAPRTLRMYQAIENMTYRPGPGKWLGFLREFYNYQRLVPDELGKFPQMLDFIEKHEIKKKSALLKVEENNGSSPSKKLGLFELIVNLRNNFAHSKGYDEETLISIFGSVEQIVDLLCLELSFLKDYQLILQPENQDDIILQGVSLPDQIKNIPTGQTLFIARENRHTRLFPLMINDQPGRTKLQDIFLMESIDNKKVFFAANRVSAEKRTDKDELATQAVKALKSIYIESEILAAEQLSWDQFRNRVIEHSSHTLSEYVLNGKYNEHVYVLPEPMSELMQSFYNSCKNLLFLHDNQGGGKSAFCAYMADEYIKHNDPNQAVFLLDARLLDELGDNAMLFDSFISKKLGVGGNLEDFFKRCKEKNKGIEITIIIDNMNEYFLSGIDQAHLIDRLFDLLYRWKDFPFIRFLAVARYEYFERSIEKYHQAFEDKKIASLTHTYLDAEGNTRITTPLPPLSEEELKQIWTNYSIHYTGYSPITGWAQLNPNVKKHCNKPLIMLFLLRHYDNRHIPARLTMDQIKNQYINGVLHEKPLRDTLFGLVNEMYRKKRPYLLTEDLDDKQLRKIADSSKDPKTLLPLNDEYNKLVGMQLIREEKVIKGELMGKKISVNNEMTLDLINQEFQKHKRRVGFRSSIVIVLSFFVLVTIISVYAFFPLYNSIEEMPILPLMIIEQHSFFDTLNHQTYSIIKEIIDNNYFFQSALLMNIVSISSIALSLLLIVIVYFILNDYLNKRKISKSIDKALAFFEIMQYHQMTKFITKKFLKFTIYASICFVIALLAWLFFGFYKNYFGLFILITIGFILSLLIYVSILQYRTILTEDTKYERYYRISSYESLKSLIISISVSFIMIFLALYYTHDLIGLSSSTINQYYSKNLMQDITALKQVASDQEINELIYFFDNNHFIDIVDVVFYNISEGLKKDYVNLYESLKMYEELDSLDINNIVNDGQHLAKNYWHILLLIFAGIFGLIIIFGVELPISFARRKRDEKKIFV